MNQRVEVHWKHDLELGMRDRHIGDGVADLGELISPALSPVHGDQQMSTARGAALNTFVLATPFLRIDHRVAGDGHIAVSDALPEKGRARPRCRREMEASESADHLPQTLFGERPLEVIRAKSRFYVRDGNPVVESSQRPEECTFRVALHHDRRPWLLRHDGFELPSASAAELGQRRSLPVQCDVRHDVEARQDLLCHIAVLAGVEPLHPRPRRRSQRVVDRSELDDFRPGARDEKDVLHVRCPRAPVA
jgi:hypothetical protein